MNKKTKDDLLKEFVEGKRYVYRKALNQIDDPDCPFTEGQDFCDGQEVLFDEPLIGYSGIFIILPAWCEEMEESNESNPMRVIDKIRQMTDDELAEYLEHIGGCIFCINEAGTIECKESNCLDGVKEFLQKEVTSED